MSDESNMMIHNERQFSRVETHIPIEVRLIPPEELQYVHSRIEYDIPIPKIPQNVEDPILAEWLHLLNKKMDILLGTITTKKENTGTLSCIAENISGGGLSFISDQMFSQGDVLEVKIQLSTKLLQIVYVYGAVIQSIKKTGSFVTALGFILLDDAIRDEIIKFVFEREREILRERRRE